MHNPISTSRYCHTMYYLVHTSTIDPSPVSIERCTGEPMIEKMTPLEISSLCIITKTVDSVSVCVG